MCGRCDDTYGDVDLDPYVADGDVRPWCGRCCRQHCETDLCGEDD